MVTRKVLIPIYRERPPSESAENFNKLRKMRFLLTAALLLLVGGFAGLGDWLVALMYDPRYALAGAIVVLIGCIQIPQIIVLTYDQAALAAGDSKRFFLLAAARAVLMIAFLVLGFETGGPDRRADRAGDRGAAGLSRRRVAGAAAGRMGSAARRGVCAAGPCGRCLRALAQLGGDRALAAQASGVATVSKARNNSP